MLCWILSFGRLQMFIKTKISLDDEVFLQHFLVVTLTFDILNSKFNQFISVLM